MELQNIQCSPKLPMAPTIELAENSRLGLTTKNVVLHQGIEVCNSNTLLGLPLACLRIASGDTVVLNNPLSFTDPDGLDGNPISSGATAAGACGAAVESGGAALPADAFCLKDLINFFESIFGGPSFHDSLKPRPNGQPWDEHNITYGPNIACGAGPGAFGASRKWSESKHAQLLVISL